jgi:putative mRNA 3-end processing factor
MFTLSIMTAGEDMNQDRDALLQVTDLGLYCQRGDFYIDPWRPVGRAVVTHAHADHLAWGCGEYLVARDGLGVARARLGEPASIATVAYGESITINGVTVSLHPAGHILGSAQVRVEHAGRVWVASGDYKVEPDGTCAAFEPIRCHLFISESTFGLPIYRWRPQREVLEGIAAWWRANRDAGRASVLFAYSLGKAQRAIAGLAAVLGDELPGPIYTHGAVEAMNRAYREAGVALPPTTYAADAGPRPEWPGALIVAPPSAHGTPWTRRFGPASTAFASGWMRIRGARRRRSVDRGFVLSDHADWPGLLAAIEATGAEAVWLTHGYTAVVARHLRERGRDAQPVATRYEGERDDPAGAEAAGVSSPPSDADHPGIDREGPASGPDG